LIQEAIKFRKKRGNRRENMKKNGAKRGKKTLAKRNDAQRTGCTCQKQHVGKRGKKKKKEWSVTDPGEKRGKGKGAVKTCTGLKGQ